MVALLTHYVESTEGGYEHQLRRAFTLACRKHDLDFAMVLGKTLDDPLSDVAVSNELHGLVDEEHFDAAILLSVGLCRYVSIEQFLDRFPKLRRLPLCSLGLQASEIPSVLSDNAGGIAQAVRHLVCDHGRRNLAFLGAEWDDQDVNSRRDAFLAEVRRLGLELGPQRIIVSHLEPVSAELAVSRLLLQDASIDGIVAANDGAAAGAQMAILRRGLRVPEDIAVTGYDDIPMAQAAEPSITTVSQQLATLATTAVDIIATQLQGARAPQVSRVPTRLVLRQSCGCDASESEAPVRHELKAALRHAFAERHRLDTMYRMLLDLARDMSAAPTPRELEQVIVTRLPDILSADCFIGVFPEPAHQQLRPILLGRGPPFSERIPAGAEFLSGLGDPSHPRVLLMMGLSSATGLIGMMAFELTDNYLDYPTIAYHISGAWHISCLREEIAEQRLLAERQAAAERTKATIVLASGVAHDLNNALGPLISLSEVVYHEVMEHRATSKVLDCDVVDDLRTIRTSALRATETVRDLMTLGRLGRVRHEPFDLVRLARNLVFAQNAELAKRNASPIHLVLDPTPSSVHVSGSESHIERAIGNVLRNALEAATPQGDVCVTISTLRVERRTKLRESIPPGGYASVSIADNGPGITEDACGRIFEPFFSTKRPGDYSGSGLGLAIVYSIIKEHHGYVDVTSGLGEGSRFTLYLPLVEAPLPLSRQAQGVQPIPGSGRILVVDDDLAQLRTAKRVLSRLGYDVTTVTSSGDALELLRSYDESPGAGPGNGSTGTAPSTPPFDVIVLDLALNAEEDGLQLFDRIRALFPDQKGILASGHAFVDHEAQIRAKDLGWLPKPYTGEALANAIRTALR